MIRAGIITPHESNEVIAFAVEELRSFLSPVPDLQFADAGASCDWTFALEIVSTMPACAFAVQTTGIVDGVQVRLMGANATGVLHAVYTLLEQVGYCFEITGQRLSQALDLERLRGWAVHIQPAVLQRGIRQHINFPMDISSYPLEEAREYIRNLARLRLNHITFHSYPGQWYAVDLPDEPLLAGAFFYGQRHDIPDHPIVGQAIRNITTFCIPEIEPDYDNPEKRSALAIQWLQAVIVEAKRVGLTVQFSFELREADLARSLATCDALLKTYPWIDILEIITQETADWWASVSVSELQAAAVAAFGADILNDPVVAAQMRYEQPGLDQLLRELGHAIQVVGVLQSQHIRLPQLAVGVYCVVPAYVKLLLYLMRRFVPADVSFTFLAQHGNRAVVESLKVADLIPEDWARSMIYSWIEFDGTMYLQQNSLQGIHQLLVSGQTTSGQSPIAGVCLNHWRTAENRTCMRYAALALLHSPLEPETFYYDYAASLGIGSVETYVQAMSLLDDVDTQSRDELLNIGFCFVGVWGDEGLSYYGRFDAGTLADVRSKYEAVQHMLSQCAESTVQQSGRAYLDFLQNRVDCTVIYLRAVEKAAELQLWVGYKSPEALTEDERKHVNEICTDAITLMDAYMARHAQALPDRGCEGTLISFYYTPPAVLKRIQEEYGGNGRKLPSLPQGLDSPPAPMG